MLYNPIMRSAFMPLPVALISTINNPGIRNIAPYSCIMPILRPLDLVWLAIILPLNPRPRRLVRKNTSVQILLAFLFFTWSRTFYAPHLKHDTEDNMDPHTRITYRFRVRETVLRPFHQEVAA